MADLNAYKMQGSDTIGNPVDVGAPAQSAAGSKQTPITASASGAAGNVTATLAAVAGKTTYISGFSVTSNGATAATVVVFALTGIVTATMNFAYVVATLNQTPQNTLTVTFNPPIPASAPNTTIQGGLPNLGAGNTQAVVSMWGFQE